MSDKKAPLTLESLCGGTLPDGLAALPEADRERLLETIVAARRHQAAELRESAERGLELVPRVLRGPVKKAILG